ncbi:hypothetical protein [Pseudovibrio sp. WM33]|uniref:hypothetical protein n=1 Tax=Pseudovibrio sp. WM33 TaxID=1735585 RepID=UPI0007AEC8CC|nr:hypothetical protein [Pseudovibrio sp. WM33]KZL17490.1 hypothetical protein PsWM33_05229 [Pseudovibrio sp. WM33]
MNHPYDPDVFLRDNVVSGDADSGVHRVSLAQLRQYVKWLERSGVSVIASSEAELASVPGSSKNIKAEVRGADNKSENGYYSWDENAAKWVKRAALDLTFGRLVDVYGSSQEIRATLIGSIESGHAVAMVGTALHTNEAGGTFISIDGDREEIFGPSGEELGAGYLVAGKAFLLTRNADGALRCSFSGDAVGAAQQATESAVAAVAARDEVLSLANDALTGGSAQVLSTLAAAQLLDLPAGVTEFWVNGNEAAGDGGQGVVLYDSDNSDLPNALYAPAKVGRFKRGIVGEIRASQLGLKDHDTLDQRDKFQDFLRVCEGENMAAVHDLGTIDCAGGTVFWNEHGKAVGGGTINGSTLRGVTPRLNRITNCYFTAGDQENYNAKPGNRSRMENIHLEGAVRFINIEGVMAIHGCTFFASQMLDYSDIPDDWMIDNTKYASIEYIVEMMFNNHPIITTTAVQNGLLANGVEGLGAMRVSQDGNLSWIGGRMNTNLEGIRWDGNPIVAGTGARRAELRGIHFESNQRSAIVVKAISDLKVDCHIRGNGDNWDTNYPLIDISSLQAKHIDIRGHIRGKTDQTVGIGVRAERVKNLKIAAEFEDLATVVEAQDFVEGIEFGMVTINNVPPNTAFRISKKAKPYLPHPLATNANSVVGSDSHLDKLSDSFTGIQIDQTKWQLNIGSDPQTEAILSNAALKVHTGADVDRTIGKNGVQIGSASIWLPERGGLQMEATVAVSTNNTYCFTGLCADPSFTKLFSVSGSDVTTVVNEAVGFVHDFASDDKNIFALSVKEGVIQSIDTGLQLNSIKDRRFLMVISETGDVTMYIDSEVVAEFSAAIIPSQVFSCVFQGGSDGLDGKDLFLKHVAVQQFSD